MMIKDQALVTTNLSSVTSAKEDIKHQTSSIILIPEPQVLYILHTFHYNIILVFFKGF